MTLEGVIDADPNVRDVYINLRVNADRLILPDAHASSRPIEGTVLARSTEYREEGFTDSKHRHKVARCHLVAIILCSN